MGKLCDNGSVFLCGFLDCFIAFEIQQHQKKI